MAEILGTLGNGDYRVQIQHRPQIGAQGTTVIGNAGELTTTRIFWSRLLDDTSTASVYVPITGVGNERCAEILQDVTPVYDELVIYRNNVEVWVGPIVNITYTDDQATIDASDLSWWINRRVPRVARNFQETDLMTIMKQLLDDFTDIGYIGMLYSLNPAGVLGDRVVALNEYKYFGDHIRELANTGIDWTVFLRRMYAGEYTVPNATPLANLKAEHFANGYQLQIRGDIMCTNAVVMGDGDASTAEYGFEDPQFSVIDQVWNEGGIKDYNSALQAAKTRWDMLKKPVIFFKNPHNVNLGLAADDLSATDSAILTPNAPVDIQKLIPGGTVGLHVNYLAKQLEFSMRLKRVSVTIENNESVELGLIPIGTTNQDE